MAKLYGLLYHILPVRLIDTDEHLHLLTAEESKHIRRCQRVSMVIAALLSVVGFLGYYLPIYWYPHLFPATTLTLPFIGSVRLPWAELLWCVLLTSIELYLLVLLNIAGVHEIAVATGFINPRTKTEKEEELLEIGLEKKPRDIVQLGIDPFQGLNKWALFLFNAIFKLKGWLGNQIIRYLMRLVLGRYAVRTVLDFAGMPLYMAINAISVYLVLREARVIIMGQAVINLLLKRLPKWELSDSDKLLLYDTLQYIAISKRDFHQNHYLLTKNLLELYNIPSEQNHILPDNYTEKFRQAPDNIRALCQLVILLGFILDGHVSNREHIKIRNLNRLGILRERYADVKRYSRSFLSGSGVDIWSDFYLSRIDKTNKLEDQRKYASSKESYMSHVTTP